MINNAQVLEILRNARNYLTNEQPDMPEDWEFGNWTECTCGHIYMAAEGHFADDEGQVFSAYSTPTGLYAEVIEEVATALGWNGNGTPGRTRHSNAAAYVSDYTQGDVDYERTTLTTEEIIRIGSLYEQRYEDMVGVVEDAIERLESAEREAMESVARRIPRKNPADQLHDELAGEPVEVR